MKIINMAKLSKTQIIQAAQILTEIIPIGWPTLQHALDEIDALLTPENTLLAAIEDDIVVGWGGMLPAYNGNVFELHPLAVRSDKRRQGIGRVIVAALEDEAKKARRLDNTCGCGR
jgi:aminoglycoside 6'-N-acetyltransferase I